MSRATRCEPQPRSRRPSSHPLRETRARLGQFPRPLTQTVDVVAPPVSAPPRDVSSNPSSRCPLRPWLRRRRRRSAAISIAGEAPPPATCAKPVPPPPSASGGGHSQDPAPALSAASCAASGQHRRPAANGRTVLRAKRRPFRSSPRARSWAPPTSYRLRRAWAAAKPSPAADEATKAHGAGGPLDLGSSVAPPTTRGGNAAGSGVVVSSQPGTKVGLPNSTGGGALAMSPSGTAKSGLGGSGGGAGIGKGNGPGSGLQGEGSGAGREGTGRGSDPNAHGGISPYPGPGGSGNGTSGAPAVPGVSVEGGTTTITLPSFGSPGGDAPSSGPGHSSGPTPTEDRATR
jgi:hypothetical protein